MKKYLLDPYIVSILFQTKDDEETFATYSSLMSRLFILIEETIKYYLNEKKIDQNKINALMQSLENPDNATVDQDIKAILREEELIKLLTESIDSFGKMFYDNLLPVLPAEDRKEVARYLDAMDPIIKYNTLLSLSSLIDLDTNTIKEIDFENLNKDASETEKLAEQSKGLISDTEAPTVASSITQPVDNLNKPVVATIMEDIGEIKDGTKEEPELPEWLANVVNTEAKPIKPIEPIEFTTVEPAPVQPEPVQPEVVEVTPAKGSPVIEKPLEEAVVPVKPIEPVAPEPVEEVKAPSSPNLISQLQDMGINLDDVPSQPTSPVNAVDSVSPVVPIADAKPVVPTDSTNPVNPVL